MDVLGDEWKPLGQILTALRAHDGRIEDRTQDLMDVYVPPDAPGNVEIPVIVKDGEITRTGIWSGPKTKRLEEEIARITPPTVDREGRRRHGVPDQEPRFHLE